MNIVYKPVGQEARPLIIENKLEDMQELVGGYIEVLQITDDIVMVCNEEGKMKHFPVNFSITADDIVGDVFFCGVDGEEFTDCPENEHGIRKILEELR